MMLSLIFWEEQNLREFAEGSGQSAGESPGEVGLWFIRMGGGL